jgi:hypothetical protein
VLIWRDYRGDVSAPQAERAFAKLMEGEVWSLLISLSSGRTIEHLWVKDLE